MNEKLLDCSKGDKSDFFKLMSVNAGRLGTKDDPTTITLQHRDDDCFESITASYQLDSKSR